MSTPLLNDLPARDKLAAAKEAHGAPPVGPGGSMDATHKIVRSIRIKQDHGRLSLAIAFDVASEVVVEEIPLGPADVAEIQRSLAEAVARLERVHDEAPADDVTGVPLAPPSSAAPAEPTPVAPQLSARPDAA
jgi:hypothetical protein